MHATKHEDKPNDDGHGGKSGHGGESETNSAEQRWERVQTLLHSASESDWRLAILEADVMLDEMVGHMGYHGDSLGEKLKGVEKSDFTTLDLAWEAHGVRNHIAHEGAAFSLTEREAQRVVKLYEDVFQEFQLYLNPILRFYLCNCSRKIKGDNTDGWSQLFRTAQNQRLNCLTW